MSGSGNCVVHLVPDYSEEVRLAVEAWGQRLGLSSAVLQSRRALAPQHLADLRKSGLSDETIRACRFQTLEGDQDVSNALNWKGGGRMLGPCLAIPFLERDGAATGFCRLRPDYPIQPDRRYEQPKGFPVRVYVPPPAWGLIDDQALPLLVTEGEKKACAAAQEGFATVGLCGVECWSVADTK